MDTGFSNGFVVEVENKATSIGESFDPLGAHLQDPYPFYAIARAMEPIFFSARVNAWCVASHAEVLAVMRDVDGFSSSGLIPRRWRLPPDFGQLIDWFQGAARPLSFVDPPDHTRIRAVVGAGLTPKSVAPFEPTIRRVVASLLDELHDRPEFEVLADFARPLVMSSMLRIAGIPAERHESFMEWSRHFFGLFIGSDPIGQQEPHLEGLRGSRRIIEEGLEYIRAVVRHRGAQPRNDLVSGLVHGECGGRRLTEDGVVGQVTALLAGGYESTTNATANAVDTLLWRREQWDRIGQRDAVTDRIISECLRYNGSLSAAFRLARRDRRISGVVIPAGSLVCLLWACANRDEKAYQRPDEFMPGRPEDIKNLSFGYGIHYCAGAPLVRLMMRIALSGLRRRFPQLHHAPGTPLRYRAMVEFRALEQLRVRQ